MNSQINYYYLEKNKRPKKRKAKRRKRKHSRKKSQKENREGQDSLKAVKTGKFSDVFFSWQTALSKVRQNQRKINEAEKFKRKSVKRKETSIKK